MGADKPLESDDKDVVAFQALATERATALGHDVEPWLPAPDAPPNGEAWRARCRRCRAVGYIRKVDGMVGVAGRLSTHPCPSGD